MKCPLVLLELTQAQAEIFGGDKHAEDAAANWLKAYNQNNINAMCELVNFILKCTGCDLQIEASDIEDVDNVPNKLGDLQDEYQQARVVDYPLVSKSKEYVGFRSVITAFFNALIKAIHTSGTLYEDTALYENVQAWVATMSSASIRPFRHTATVISLAMTTALCEVARDVLSTISTTRNQVEIEKKKKSLNKGRINGMEKLIAADETKLEAVETVLKDEFDLVFVHRYRDVDSKIRAECVNALGTWILTYRKMYLEGQYLRYLGWVLSDTVSHTRSEVIKQLRLLFKNSKNIGALRAFTDRFRPRIIEMAVRDAEAGVRVETIELLDRLREAELLEPDDIDAVGKLIFDTEPRVRKAVARFFVSNIEDLYIANTEGIDKDAFDAAIPDTNNDDYLAPTQAWIKYRCLAQTLTMVDTGEEDNGSRPADLRDVLVAGSLDSRYMLATEAIFPHMKELQEWETLAGYLLFDHSQISTDIEDPDAGAAVQGIYKLEEGEDIILLEVLDYAVKLHLLSFTETQMDKKKGRRAQASKNDVHEKQETAASNLTQIIPLLLNRYGSLPQAASAILRLEHLLNLDLVNEMQNIESAYGGILNDINKQFMTHSDRDVLAEASLALLNARKSAQAKEIADVKVQDIWDDTIGTLHNLLRNQNLGVRGTLSSNVLREISNTVSRLANLASISDCATALEVKLASSRDGKQKSRSASMSPVELLLDVAKRGVYDKETTTQFAALEDDLANGVIRTILFYFMWSVQRIRALIMSSDVRNLTVDFFTRLVHYSTLFGETLLSIASSRVPLDPVRLVAISAALDLHTVFSTLRHASPGINTEPSDEIMACTKSLISPISEPFQTLILQTHDRFQRSFAKRTRRKLEDAPAVEPAEHDAPIDSEDEDEENDDEAGVVGSGKEAKKEAALLTEQSLCDLTAKIVLAVTGQAMDLKVKERLLRNKNRLGPNYREVVAYLEEKKKDKKSGPKGLAGNVKKTLADDRKRPKSQAMVLEEDDIEDDEGEEVRDDVDDDVLEEKGLVGDDEIEENAPHADDEPESVEDNLVGD